MRSPSHRLRVVFHVAPTDARLDKRHDTANHGVQPNLALNAPARR